MSTRDKVNAISTPKGNSVSDGKHKKKSLENDKTPGLGVQKDLWNKLSKTVVNLPIMDFTILAFQ